MRWIIHYDIVAFAIIAVILIVYSVYNHLNTFSNRVYKNLLIVSLLSVVTDIASAWAGSFLGQNQNVLNYTIHIIHFIVQNFVPCIYSFFAYSLVYDYTKEKLSTKWFSLIFVPYIFNFSLIISTPITGACFYIDELGVYHRGAGQFFTYGIAIYYLVLSCVIVIKNMKVLSTAQRFSVFLYTGEAIVLNIIQILCPQYLLQEICIAFAMFFIYITMQNPLEYIDTTTGAYNRDLFKKTVNNKLVKKEGFNVISIKIVGLEYIYKKFGIHSENVILRKLTDFLFDIKKDISIFALSSRQFALIIPEKYKTKEIAEKIKERFENSFAFDKMHLTVKLAARICCIQNTRQINSMNDLFNIIDYSMGKNKKNKETCIIEVSPEVLDKQKREFNISLALSNAIARKSFQVFYQPVYNAKNNRFIGLEALVRLKDSNLGMISPEEFIPLAEKDGSIIAIGEIVLEKVCKFVEQYHPEDFGIKSVNINLSTIQCMQENSIYKLTSITNDYRIPKGFINFEVTEQTGENILNFENIIAECSKKGINFTLDNYGAGHCSQCNLLKYNYSAVKIDKSRIWNCEFDEKCQISLKHMVSMLTELGMTVIAQGVESQAQNDLLCELGCENMQGFYFAKPLAQDDIMELIRNKNTSL